jgi:hypothetical protein
MTALDSIRHVLRAQGLDLADPEREPEQVKNGVWRCECVSRMARKPAGVRLVERKGSRWTVDRMEEKTGPSERDVAFGGGGGSGE